MNTLEILTQGLELIRDPKHWTQEHLARDSDGAPLHFASLAAACSWCSLGALIKVCPEIDASYYLARRHLEQAAAPLSIDNFNDSHTHQQVVQLWEKAIEHARNSQSST